MENKYSARTIEAPKIQVPPIALRVVEGYRGKDLVMTEDAFDKNKEHIILEKVSETRSITYGGKVVEAGFRLPLTGESLARTVADFDNIKEDILDFPWLQLGRSLQLSGKRLVVNPPKDERGNYITNEKEIEGYIHSAEEVGGVWFGDNGFAYIEEIRTGEMSVEEASENGLVRALEGSRGKAKDFLAIGSKENYSAGVCVSGLFGGNVKEPELGVPAMGSGWRNFRRLDVGGNGIEGGQYCYVFGVLDSIGN